MKAVTVAVCTRNRARVLPVCLRSLAAQSDPMVPFEVIVVDDGSTDETREVASASADLHGSFRYIRQDPAGLSSARNQAVRAATGELICFIDDDAEASPDWLKEVVLGAARHPDVGCFTGRTLERLEGIAPRSCGREPIAGGLLDAGDEEHEIDHVMGVNLSIRRRTFEQIGLFNPALVSRGDEDEWFARCRRLGGKAVYLPRATVWHRRRAEDLRPWSLLKTKFRWGVAQIQYKRETATPFDPQIELKGLAHGILHGIRRRCFGGFIDSAIHAGAIWTALTGELRRPTTEAPGLPVSSELPTEGQTQNEH